MDIFVDVRHCDFWWGVYGFTSGTSWEDFILYRRIFFRYKKIACFSANARSFMEDRSDEEKSDQDTSEKEFYNELHDFLKSCKIAFHYYYDNIGCEDFYEVPFDAPRNEQGIKPSSIEIWHPASGLNLQQADECIHAFNMKFLYLPICNIRWKSKPSFKKSKKAFCKDNNQTSNPKVVFTKELVAEMADKLNKPTEDVKKLLKKSVGNETPVEFIPD
jgi:hypothetical protein